MARVKRGWFGADPKPEVELPPVGPGFVSMDDAARYAHHQMGGAQDKEYGGVIMQSLADDLFYATDPIEGGENFFDVGTVLNEDSNKRLLHPEGYRCVAEYHSHPDFFTQYKSNNPELSARQIKALNSFYSEPDLIGNILDPVFFSAFYVSGPDGSLFKHVPTRSEAERRFAVWLRDKEPFGRPEGYDGVVENLFKKVASVSQLSIVVSNAVWGGSTGEVPHTWTPYRAFKTKTQELPPCGPVQASLTDALSHARARLAAMPGAAQYVFLLKHDTQDLYGVTEPSGTVDRQPSVQEVFPKDMDGKHRLPAHFHLIGVCLGKAGYAALAQTRQPWLYRNFFSPPELVRHLYQGRLVPELLKQSGLSIFLNTEDGAVLRYTCSFSAIEAQLYRVEPDGAIVDNQIDSTLIAGSLKPSEFVQRLAAAGQLTVLKASAPGKGSQLWDKTGTVEANWRPFSGIPLPVFSPAFITADDAARWAHAVIGQRRDIEYGGVVFKRGNRFYATDPIAGERVQFDHGRMLARDSEGKFIAPDDYQAEAFYHSHPADAEGIKRALPHFTADQVQVFNNFYSGADQLFSFEKRTFAKVHYLSGPDDVLLKYVSSGSIAEKTLDLQLRGGPGETSSDFEHPIRLLAAAGELWTVIANPVWGGVRGRISNTWRIRTPATLAPQQPFFTQVFSRPELAVLRALSLAGSEGGRCGFVLKHSRDDAYVATLALPKGDPLFSPNLVFPKRPDGKLRLPSQFRLEAIYFSSWYETGEIAARETWLASTFFTPAQVVAATRQARASQDIQNPARGLSLYMLASDSSLLSFRVPAATNTTDLVRETDTGELNDNGAQAAMLTGTLSPRAYVRRVIAATDLSVVQAGGLWRKVGRVDNRSNLIESFYKATLSRSFLSARDAAVYAHEQINNWRGGYYGGYILKGEDGRFVITEPVSSAANPFAFTLFFPRDGNGPLIPPEPYVLHARYGSHTALSMVSPSWVARRGWTHEEAQINLQVFSDDEMYSIIPAGRVAYLSGASDCLLEYTPNHSAQEQLLLANIGPQAGDNSLGKRLDNGQIRPADWVRRLAEAGDFKIILGNPLWGQRSVVYNDWTPNYSYAPRSGPPDYTTYGAVFASADEAARNLHGRVHARNFAQAACFAFILKHRDKEQYIASEVVGVVSESELFNLNSLFELKPEGGYQLPDGFILHGLFRSQQWSRAGQNTSNAWLTLFFVTPTVLFSALYAAIRSGPSNLSVYFSTLDGALLRYEPPRLDVKSGGPADTLLTQAQQALDSGEKTPQSFLSEWALKGMLHVVRTSQFWDKKGQVAPSWSSYATLTPRRLSPCFASADDAARYAAARVNNGYYRRFAGVILRLGNGLFVSTEPLALPPQGLALHWIYPDRAADLALYPQNSTIVARYRSLIDQEGPLLLSVAQKAIYKTMIPTAVLSNLLRREAHLNREYVFGPSGSILSYHLSGSAEEERLKDRLAPLNKVKGDYGDNSIEQQLRSGTLSPQDFITEVVKAGNLSVIEGDGVWGPPRKLVGDFVANIPPTHPGDIRAVFMDAPCSPIFTRAVDAVRYAQRLWKPQTEVAFGYVLKSANKPFYKATLALVRDDFADFKQVFIDGQLPQGYVFDGLYLCASTVAIAGSNDEMARSFFPPQYIAKALNVVTYARNGSAPTLYLLCSDGALLTYEFPKTAPLYPWTSKAHIERTQLLDASLTVRDYVRRLAGAGKLYIRVTSEVWGKKERVTEHWEPNKAPHAFADDPHFHSFCGPLFTYTDDAARYAQGLVAPFKGKQYLGAVLVPGQTPGYVALDPVEDQGTGSTSTLELLFWADHAGFDVPPENTLSTYKIAAVQAFYKAIASTSSFEAIDKELLGNFVAKDDLHDYVSVARANAPDAESCYLSCRNGALLKYVPAFTASEDRLLAPGMAPVPRVFVARLRTLGKLSVLVTDAFWRVAGPLGEEWSEAEPEPEEFWYERNRDEL
ncbi:DUF4329 domain-containing protein [Pseudomonas sp. OE 28.3]|uniref:DUF4329 domain-containing protein n=1 Tax=Pseudomonas sp. OE 28.3 TaxID=2745519 RepID=UPI001648BB12|nr:DUF4329 domain-containing protein [Pseudomonas sp. OE 28.3]QXI59923.1 DUF4329 domain-containing protein [Pseudomonas sp. OE 28.3]